MRGFDASLTDQAAQLSKSIHNRERKRNAEKLQRQLNAENGETADQGAAAKRQARVQESAAVAAARAAAAAAAAAAQLRTQDIQRCELCQASFPSEALYQQHVQGPVHQKALAKAREAAIKAAHTSQYQQLAEGATAAALWQRGGAGTAAGPAAKGGPSRQQGAAAGGAGSKQGRQGRRQEQQQRGPAPGSLLSHAELVASAQAKQEPLSIGGWVPPAIIAPASQAAPAAVPNSSSEDSGSDEEQEEEDAAAEAAVAQQEGNAHQVEQQPSHAAAEAAGGSGGTADSSSGDGAGLGGLLGYLASGSDED